MEESDPNLHFSHVKLQVHGHSIVPLLSHFISALAAMQSHWYYVVFDKELVERFFDSMHSGCEQDNMYVVMFCNEMMLCMVVLQLSMHEHFISGILFSCSLLLLSLPPELNTLRHLNCDFGVIYHKCV